MSKKEQYSGDTKVDQRPDIVGDTDLKERESDIIQVEKSVHSKEYLDELKFNDDPVEIRLEPSSDANAPTSVPVWVNGRGAEVLMKNGRWMTITYLPVGIPLVTKRKYVAGLVNAKLDKIHTEYTIPSKPDEEIENKVKTFTSAYHSFSILHDPSPRGSAWLTEMLRRRA